MAKFKLTKPKKIIMLVLAIVALISAITMSAAVFTDRVNRTTTISVGSWDIEGYSIDRTVETGYYTAGETLEVKLEESNTGSDDISSAVQMTVTWDSLVSGVYPWGNDSADNAVITYGSASGDTIDYTVNNDKTITFTVPDNAIAAGKTEENALYFHIPGDLAPTGTLDFNFDKVDLKSGNTTDTYDESLDPLDFSIDVVWNITKNSSNIITGSINKDVIAFLTDTDEDDVLDLAILKNGTTSNTNGGAMMDWTAAGKTPWAAYNIEDVAFTGSNANGYVVNIGDYAFAGETGITAIDIPDSITDIGISAFDGSGLTGEVTIPASVSNIEKLAFGNLPGVNEFTFEHTSSDPLSLPDNKAAENRTSGAFYLPEDEYVNTTVNSDVDAIQYEYRWNIGYDNRRPIPILAEQQTWFEPLTELTYDYDGTTYNYATTNIDHITFKDWYVPSDNLIQSWDASANGDGSVMAYLVTNDDGSWNVILAGNGYGSIMANQDSTGAFQNFTNVQEYTDIELLNTSNTTNMSNMFLNNGALTSLDLRTFDVSDVTHFDYMFCMESSGSSLTSLNVSNWDTSSATHTPGMFVNLYKLTELDVSEWNTSSLIDANYMFHGCTRITTLDIARKEVNDGAYIAWDTPKLQDTSYMFEFMQSVEELDISEWDLSAATITNNMLANCEALTSLTLPASLTTFGADFASECINATTITFLHDEDTALGLPTAGYGSAFYVSENVETTIVATNTEALDYNWKSDNRTKTPAALLYSDGTMIFQIGNAPTYTSADLVARYKLFDTTVYAQAVTSDDPSYSSTKKTVPWTENMDSIQRVIIQDDMTVYGTGYWFYGADNLESFGGTGTLTLKNAFSASNTFTRYMFYNAESLTSVDVSRIDSSNVRNASSMFEGCSALEALDLSTFETTNISSSSNLKKFASGCTELTTIVLNENFGQSGKVPSAGSSSGMFFVEDLTETTVIGANSVMLAYEWATDNREPTFSDVVLEITAQPAKTVYKVGENFETDGMEVKLIYGDGTEEDVTSLITIPDGTSLKEGQSYVTVKYETGNTSLTALVNITVYEPVSIATHPENVTIANGKTATFKVSAAGEDLTYQWQYSADSGSTWNNTSLNGYNTATLSFAASSAEDGRQYRCVVTDKYGNTATSNAATLDAYTALAITTHPADATAAIGTAPTFSVVATGEGLTYQWQECKVGGSWTDLTGCTGSAQKVTASTARDGAQYRCVVTDAYGNTVTSNAATMDAYTALAITSHPEDVTIAIGNTATFNVTATGEELTYQWQYSADSGNTWANSALTGNTTATFSVTANAGRDGYQYRCVVTDKYSNTVTSNAVTLDTYTALAITKQPADVTTTATGSASFSVTATGEGLTYQWQYSADSGSTWASAQGTGNTTATMTFDPAQSFRNGYQYRCVITDAYGNTVTSNTATLTVGKATGYVTLSASSGSVTYNKTGTFTIKTNHGGTLSVKSADTSIATASISGTTVTVKGVKAGSTTITVTCAATDTYAAATAKYTLTVNKATGYVTLSATSGSVTYNKTGTFTVATNHGGTLSVASAATGTATASISGTTVTVKGVKAGSTTITVTCAATTNYTAATAKYTLTVNKATGYVTLSATSGSVTYNKTGTFTVATNHGGTLSVASAATGTATASISGTTVTVKGVKAGSTTITVTCAATTNYTAATAKYTLTVNKATGSLTVSPTTLSIAKGGTGTITATRSGNGTVSATSSNTSIATVSVSGTKITVTGKAAGTVTITVKCAAGTNHTAPANKTVTVYVAPDAGTEYIITETQTWVVPATGYYDLELHGGGGGGSSGYSYEDDEGNTMRYNGDGGGGSGSYWTNVYLTAGTKISVVIGAGGAGAPEGHFAVYSEDGEASSFGTYTVAGGAGGDNRGTGAGAENTPWFLHPAQDGGEEDYVNVDQDSNGDGLPDHSAASGDGGYGGGYYGDTYGTGGDGTDDGNPGAAILTYHGTTARTEIPLSKVMPGIAINLDVNGTATKFIVAHQGNPDSEKYTMSADSTWLVMNDVYNGEQRVWNDSYMSKPSYAKTSIHTYLNGDFYNLLDSDVQASILEVTIPYAVVKYDSSEGEYYSELSETGLSTKVFLLSEEEIRYKSVDKGAERDGELLDYFNDLNSTGQTTTAWWTRSISNDLDTVLAANSEGTGYESLENYDDTSGVRPAMVLNNAATVDFSSGNFIGGVSAASTSVAAASEDAIELAFAGDEVYDYSISE